MVNRLCRQRITNRQQKTHWICYVFSICFFSSFLWCFILFDGETYTPPNNFQSVQVLEILFSSLNESKNCKFFLRLCQPYMFQLYLQRTRLIHQCLTLLRFFPVWKNISLIVNQCRFFYFWERPWNSDEWARKKHYVPHLGSRCFFI